MAVDAAAERCGLAVGVVRAIGELVRWQIVQRSAPRGWAGATSSNTSGLAQPLVSHHLQGPAPRAEPLAMGASIGGAYFFTSSPSFANHPSRSGWALTDTFAGTAPASVPGFVTCQPFGDGFALALARFPYPDLAEVTDDVVVPHDARP